jgi:hypothetical protein
MNEHDKIKLILDGSRGIYIPNNFAVLFNHKDWGISDDDAEILKNGPGAKLYWETWDEVLNNAKYKDKSGFTWNLHQDDDLDDLLAIREDYFNEE